MEAVDELVDLLGDRVQVEARTVRGRDSEPVHERLAAVVAGADGDALKIALHKAKGTPLPDGLAGLDELEIL